MGILCVYTGPLTKTEFLMKKETEPKDLEYSHMHHAQLNRDLQEVLDFAKNILDDHNNLRTHVEKLVNYIDVVRRGSN